MNNDTQHFLHMRDQQLVTSASTATNPATIPDSIFGSNATNFGTNELSTASTTAWSVGGSGNIPTAVSSNASTVAWTVAASAVVKLTTSWYTCTITSGNNDSTASADDAPANDALTASTTVVTWLALSTAPDVGTGTGASWTEEEDIFNFELDTKVIMRFE